MIKTYLVVFVIWDLGFYEKCSSFFLVFSEEKKYNPLKWLKSPGSFKSLNDL